MTSGLRYGVQAVLVAALYFAAAKLALALAIPPGYATAIWPSSGIALAALLLLGWRAWPGVWAGAALVNFTIQYSAPLAAAIATGNTLEALAAAVLVRRYIGAQGRFERGEHVARFVVVNFASCVIAATVATLALGIGGFMTWQAFSNNWWTWWLGDVAGIIIVTPLVLSWSRSWRFAWSVGRALECAALSGLLVVTVLVVFGGWLAGDKAYPLAFLLVPLIVWAAFRFTQREVATAIAGVSAFAVWFTVEGSGPFAAESINRSLQLLQAFVSTVAVTGLALSVILEERRRMEARLRLANEELERFAYVAAHDLQEPLRTVVNFADLLSRGYHDRLDGKGREFLGFIESGTTRMRRILSDLLAFAQIGSKDPIRRAVDCEAVLANVREGLRAALEEAGATVTHDRLPTVAGDATLLELLFQNLIGNAVKFRSQSPLSIHIGVRRQDSDWVFSVRDNGIGIDPEHFGVIFDMFQRLHGADRYPGTGIGLTICRKVLERHDGRIWVESRTDAGTTFFFAIPAR